MSLRCARRDCSEGRALREGPVRRWREGRRRPDGAFIGYGTLSAKQLIAAGAARQAARESPTTWDVGRQAMPSVQPRKDQVSGTGDLLVFRPAAATRFAARKSSPTSHAAGTCRHSATCPNVVNLLYDPERRIDVEWEGARRRCQCPPAIVFEAFDAAEDPQGYARGGQRQDLDINTNIPNMEARTAADERRAHRRDGGNQRDAAPREGDQGAQVGARRDLMSKARAVPRSSSSHAPFTLATSHPAAGDARALSPARSGETRQATRPRWTWPGRDSFASRGCRAFVTGVGIIPPRRRTVRPKPTCGCW